jgi:hypothetical protein
MAMRSLLTVRRNFAHTVSQNLGENWHTRTTSDARIKKLVPTNDLPQIQMIKMWLAIDATERAITPQLVPILLPLEDVEAEINVKEEGVGVDVVAHIIGLRMMKERLNTQLLWLLQFPLFQPRHRLATCSPQLLRIFLGSYRVI